MAGDRVYNAALTGGKVRSQPGIRGGSMAKASKCRSDWQEGSRTRLIWVQKKHN